MDPDVLVIGDLGEAFAAPFDYAVTISEGAAQPINGAMHFVHAQQYAGAIATIKGVLEGCACVWSAHAHDTVRRVTAACHLRSCSSPCNDDKQSLACQLWCCQTVNRLPQRSCTDCSCGVGRYQINHEVGFTSGQRAYSDYLGISDDITTVKLLNKEATEQGSSCLQSHGQQVPLAIHPLAASIAQLCRRLHSKPTCIVLASLMPGVPAGTSKGLQMVSQSALDHPAAPRAGRAELGCPRQVPAAETITTGKPDLRIVSQVCFLTCLRFNFWEDCDHQPTMPIRPEVAADYVAADVKVLHFIAYRKLGIQVCSCGPLQAHLPAGRARVQWSRSTALSTL